MSDIKLELKDFIVEFKIVEIDERLPSVNFEISLEAIQFNHMFTYKGAIWIENNVLDEFSRDLALLETAKAELYSLDRGFQFIVEKMPKEQLSCVVGRKSNSGGVIEMRYRSSVDLDVITKIIETFRAFPKWW
jgi:hypothetical protein